MKITVTDHIIECLTDLFLRQTGLDVYATDDDSLIAIAKKLKMPEDYFVNLRDYYEQEHKKT